MKSGRYVKVRRGDTFNKIAKRYGLSGNALVSANPAVNRLVIGEYIFVPKRMGILAPSIDDYIKNYSSGGAVSLRGVKGKFLWPVPSARRISSYFGKRGRKDHHGIDIPAWTGSHILAAESGKVIYSGNGLSGFGNLTIIKHSNNLFSIYAHAKKNFLKKGDKVHKGQVIAQVGSTGRSTGPHLHFEIRKRDTPINPLPLLSGLPDPVRRDVASTH